MDKEKSQLYDSGVYFLEDDGSVLDAYCTDPPPPPEVPPPKFTDVKEHVYMGIAEMYLKQEAQDNTFLCESLPSELHTLPQKDNLFKKFPFHTINIMSQCHFVCTNGRTEFNLKYLCSVKNQMFYAPKKLPSLLVYLGDLAPTALFTRTGVLTMTGGSSLEEIQYCMSICCHKILYVLSKVYPYKTFELRNFGIFNKVCKSRLVGFKINLQAFVDRARHYGYSVKYDADQINMAYLSPGPPFDTSIKASVAARGGILIMGFTKRAEARTIALLLSFLLRGALRHYDQTKTTPQGPDRMRLKQNKKKKNIQKWEKLSEPMPYRGD